MYNLSSSPRGEIFSRKGDAYIKKGCCGEQPFFFVAIQFGVRYRGIYLLCTMLCETLRDDVVKAMKARDSVRLGTLRLALAACTNALIDAGKKPTETLEDEETVSVLKRLVKQRRESAEQYRVVGQEERASAEDAERVILEEYLPEEMSEEEVRSVVLRVQKELGVSEKKDTGLLMKTVMKELQGKVDGSVAAKIAGEVLR